MLRVFCLLAVGTFLSATLGCDGGVATESPVAVTGKIIYQGKPVEGAQVTFHNTSEAGGRSASGRTAADGTFSLTTFKTGDGAVPGNYIVTVSKVEGGASDDIDVGEDDYGDDYGAMMDGAAGDADAALQDNKLPEKYASTTDSGIERTVAENPPNEFEIELQ